MPINVTTRSRAWGDDLLTLQEAAEIREDDGSRRYWSVATLRSRIRQGRLAAVRTDGGYRVRREQLDFARDEDRRAELRREERDERYLDKLAENFVERMPPLTEEQCRVVSHMLFSPREQTPEPREHRDE